MLNTAQEFYQALPEGFKNRSYKAPHANRPTPPRPHHRRDDKLKLFKGHRP